MYNANSYKNLLLSWNNEVDNDQVSKYSNKNLFTIIIKPVSYDRK